jgi:hypothetical protein
MGGAMKRVAILSSSVWVAAALCASGCSKHAQRQVADYPDSIHVSASNDEQPDGTTFYSKRRTPATAGMVRQFYEQLLSSRPGWHLEGLNWTNGNVDPQGQPLDKTRDSGKVVMTETPDQTYVEIFEFVVNPNHRPTANPNPN